SAATPAARPQRPRSVCASATGCVPASKPVACRATAAGGSSPRRAGSTAAADRARRIGMADLQTSVSRLLFVKVIALRADDVARVVACDDFHEFMCRGRMFGAFQQYHLLTDGLMKIDRHIPMATRDVVVVDEPLRARHESRGCRPGID